MNSHKLTKFIHWTFTLLYAYGIFKQVDDLTELEDASLLNFEILFNNIFNPCFSKVFLHERYPPHY